MIPELDGNGFLPVGVHDCELHEVLERFGRFQRTEQRVRLGTSLEDLMAEVRSAGIFTHVVIDGSFVTAKPDPDDIDLILVMPADFNPSPDLPAMVQLLLSSRQARRRWRFDILAAPDGSLALQKLIHAFTEVKDFPGQSKGMLRVRP